MPFEMLIEGTPVSDQTRNRQNRSRWIEAVRAQAAEAVIDAVGWRSNQDGPLMVTISYFHSTPLPGDVDNYVKPILDGLKTVAYVDDGQIERLVIQKLDPDVHWVFSQPSNMLAAAIGSIDSVVYIRVDDDLSWRSVP